MFLGPDGNLEINEKSEEPQVLNFKGTIDSSNAYVLQDYLEKKIALGHLILEINEVEIITSTGIGVLCEINEEMNHPQRKMVLVNPAVRVRQILELSGFNRVFSVEDTLEKAIERVSKKS